MRFSLFKNQNRNWYYKYGSIFIFLVIIYIIAHTATLRTGEEIVNFTDQEKANIETLIDNVIFTNSTTLAAGAQQVNKRNAPDKLKNTIINDLEKFIRSRYDLADSESLQDLKLFLVQYANAGFPPSFLIDYKLRVHSFFWLTEDAVFLEIIFWSLFGVLCSLFYYISEAMAKGEFKPNQEYIHAAKLFYAPVTSLVIYFSLNALISSGEANLNNLKHGLVILSYILGFFSGRTIELLSRLKDLILPIGKQNEDQAAGSALDFQKLGEEEQHELILRAIDANDTKWRTTLPKILSIGSGKKYIDGKKTSLNAITFEVNEKTENLDSQDKIPEFVPFEGYAIPTDVQERTELVKTQSRKAPGSSVSRKGVDACGTVGLRVFQTNNSIQESYLLSCYHVLCHPELKQKVFEVKDSVTKEEPRVVCPAEKDARNENRNIIATIKAGKFNQFIDAAIAKLSDESLLSPDIEGIIGTKIYDLKKGDEDSSFRVKTFGAASRFANIKQPRIGKILKISDNPTIKYTSPIGNRVVKQLIQVEKISVEGDSGGPVFTMDGEVIGLIIAGDSTHVSYVLPIRTILNGLSIQL